MLDEYFLKAAGIYHFIAVLSHFGMAKRYKWDEALAVLAPDRRDEIGKTLGVMNVSITILLSSLCPKNPLNTHAIDNPLL